MFKVQNFFFRIRTLYFQKKVELCLHPGGWKKKLKKIIALFATSRDLKLECKNLVFAVSEEKILHEEIEQMNPSP